MEFSAQTEPLTSIADPQPKMVPPAADVTVTQFLRTKHDKIRGVDRGDGDADRDAQLALESNITEPFSTHRWRRSISLKV